LLNGVLLRQLSQEMPRYNKDCRDLGGSCLTTYSQPTWPPTRQLNWITKVTFQAFFSTISTRSTIFTFLPAPGNLSSILNVYLVLKAPCQETWRKNFV